MVNPRFDYLGDLVRSFLIGSEFASFPFLGILEHLPENEVA